MLQTPTTPDVSVILPSYNRAHHLDQCIASVVEQSFDRWELLVVDDGSQDDTFAVVNRWLQQSDKIRYLKHQNRGAGLSRNVGIQASFGHYITFIDSDDRYLPDHLQTRVDYMNHHPHVDLISGGFKTEEEVWVVDYFQPDRKINIRECVICPTFFGKREVFFALNGFNDAIYGEDTDLWLRAEQQFNTEKLTTPETYLYTRASDSTSRVYTDSQIS